MEMAYRDRWRAEIAELQRILSGSGLREERKWGKPCYTLDGKNVVIIQGDDKRAADRTLRRKRRSASRFVNRQMVPWTAPGVRVVVPCSITQQARNEAD
ncbi:MAG: hypothetical protein AB7U18_15465 [Dehalococcoidia bacterium]